MDKSALCSVEVNRAMQMAEELSLLIKSKYPVVYVEAVDEDHALEQLREIAAELGMILYHWSVTEGLRRIGANGSFYLTGEPLKMLRTALTLLNADGSPGLFILKDFHKFLEDPLVVRQFKDFIGAIKNMRDTVIILAPEYKLPAELEPVSAHIIGGYPGHAEILRELKAVLAELTRADGRIKNELAPAEIERAAHALRGLTLQQIRNIVTSVVIDDQRLNAADLRAIELYKKKIFDREGLLEYCAAVSADEIAGFSNLKQWLAERGESFTQAAPTLPPPKGVMLLGVQGCGKSLAAKVTAGLLGLPLYRLDLGRLYSPYIGQTEQNLRKALQMTDKLAPLCLWLDEIEKAFAASDGQADGGVSQRVLGTFLTWMQERKNQCLMVATANDVYRLPPEFLRKGRFDEIFFVGLPTRLEREELFRLHLKKRGLDPGRFDLSALAGWTEDFSGAEIEQLIISALYSAANQREDLRTDHILVKAHGTKPLAVLKAEDIAALRAWARERTVPV